MFLGHNILLWSFIWKLFLIHTSLTSLYVKLLQHLNNISIIKLVGTVSFTNNFTTPLLCKALRKKLATVCWCSRAVLSMKNSVFILKQYDYFTILILTKKDFTHFSPCVHILVFWGYARDYLYYHKLQ